MHKTQRSPYRAPGLRERNGRNMADPAEEPFRGTPRFELKRRLGAGAFGVVYEALDLERNSVVALKTLRRTGEEALYRLKQEFRALADIAHPNLAALYELLSDGHQWFFTMELVEGKSFHDYVLDPEDVPIEQTEAEALDSIRDTATFDSPSELRPPVAAPRPLSGYPSARFHPERLRSSLRQTALGIQALHAAGKLHRDIKSSNVLVTRSDRVVLLDFGLVTELGLADDNDHSMVLAGTPAYMSPEQGAGQPVSEASDWYSLGVMLYESLTGQAPFAGTTAEMIREKQHREPRRPRELVSGVPEDLDQLCCDLLRRDPKRRPDGPEIIRRLGGEVGDRELASSVAGTRTSPFVGRAIEFAQLQEAFHDAEKGRAVTMAVHGGSGMGKTALVRRFLDALRSDERVVILAGRCFERETVPYKALDSLMDGLSRHLKNLTTSRAEALMPRDILALARLFPVLRRVEAVAAARRRVLEIQDVQELRRRAFGAFRELMARLAEEHPLILFIDDLHWGDVDSAALLEELVRPPDPPSLLLILAYRSEEAETSSLLRRVLPSKLGSEIVVDPLEPADARELADALLHDSPRKSEDMAEAVARESSGNPFFLSELARSVRSHGDLVAVRSEGAPEEPITLDRVIASRIARLSPAVRRFLEIVAVAGRPVLFSVVNTAAEPDPRENVIEMLRIHHLIRTRETENREEIETYHDRIREAVVAGLSDADLKSHHRRLAIALETSGQTDPDWLALHWKEAGEFERAA